MIDTHCHVFKEYYPDISRLMEELKSEGIDKIIINGTDMASNNEVLDLVKKYDFVYGAIGFHPTELDEIKEEDFIWLKDHVNDEKIVAIGEIGLDYHYEDTNKNMQKNVFERQLRIAEEFNKPVIVHSRDAIQDTYDILNKYNLSGSIHAFSGSVMMAKKFIAKGFLLGIGGVVTFKNAKNILDVINNIDLEYILLETDSPYLSPEPFRGKTNKPSNVRIIAKKIGEIKNISEEEVVKITTSNAKRLFDF